jgi:hypothetical protein
MPMAGAPRNLTQKDAQGAVTVEVTVLTPDQPCADGKLAVQIKLDTHAVNLDPYPLETLAVWRDAQGREIQALGLESASGGGSRDESAPWLEGRRRREPCDPTSMPMIIPITGLNRPLWNR